MPIRPPADAKYLYLSGVLAIAALAPPAAEAALGAAESTVAADAEGMHGTVKSTARAQYRVHEIQLESGTVLREFVTLDGRVFAVSWRGPTIPNLQQMLGRYFGAFTAAARAPHGGHHQLRIQQDNFVMQSSGHMRAFSGSAYEPQSVPAGVSLDELH